MVAKTRYYADGGKVSTDKPPPKPRPPAPKPPPKGDTVQMDPKGSTADTLRNHRARQMEALGLKDGGKVKRRKKKRY